ncbi:hypothetical protein TGPRC2_427390, partial [Toxoplasma gondii TgCatPRC2]
SQQETRDARKAPDVCETVERAEGSGGAESGREEAVVFGPMTEAEAQATRWPDAPVETSAEPRQELRDAQMAPNVGDGVGTAEQSEGAESDREEAVVFGAKTEAEAQARGLPDAPVQTSVERKPVSRELKDRRSLRHIEASGERGRGPEKAGVSVWRARNVMEECGPDRNAVEGRSCSQSDLFELHDGAVCHIQTEMGEGGLKGSESKDLRQLPLGWIGSSVSGVVAGVSTGTFAVPVAPCPTEGGEPNEPTREVYTHRSVTGCFARTEKQEHSGPMSADAAEELRMTRDALSVFSSPPSSPRSVPLLNHARSHPEVPRLDLYWLKKGGRRRPIKTRSDLELCTPTQVTGQALPRIATVDAIPVIQACDGPEAIKAGIIASLFEDDLSEFESLPKQSEVSVSSVSDAVTPAVLCHDASSPASSFKPRNIVQASRPQHHQSLRSSAGSAQTAAARSRLHTQGVAAESKTESSGNPFAIAMQNVEQNGGGHAPSSLDRAHRVETATSSQQAAASVLRKRASDRSESDPAVFDGVSSQYGMGLESLKKTGTVVEAANPCSSAGYERFSSTLSSTNMPISASPRSQSQSALVDGLRRSSWNLSDDVHAAKAATTERGSARTRGTQQLVGEKDKKASVSLPVQEKADQGIVTLGMPREAKGRFPVPTSTAEAPGDSLCVDDAGGTSALFANHKEAILSKKKTQTEQPKEAEHWGSGDTKLKKASKDERRTPFISRSEAMFGTLSGGPVSMSCRCKDDSEGVPGRRLAKACETKAGAVGNTFNSGEARETVDMAQTSANQGTGEVPQARPAVEHPLVTRENQINEASGGADFFGEKALGQERAAPAQEPKDGDRSRVSLQQPEIEGSSKSKQIRRQSVSGISHPPALAVASSQREKLGRLSRTPKGKTGHLEKQSVQRTALLSEPAEGARVLMAENRRQKITPGVCLQAAQANARVDSAIQRFKQGVPAREKGVQLTSVDAASDRKPLIDETTSSQDIEFSKRPRIPKSLSVARPADKARSKPAASSTSVTTVESSKIRNESSTRPSAPAPKLSDVAGRETPVECMNVSERQSRLTLPKAGVGEDVSAVRARVARSSASIFGFRRNAQEHLDGGREVSVQRGRGTEPRQLGKKAFISWAAHRENLQPTGMKNPSKPLQPKYPVAASDILISRTRQHVSEDSVSIDSEGQEHRAAAQREAVPQTVHPVSRSLQVFRIPTIRTQRFGVRGSVHNPSVAESKASDSQEQRSVSSSASPPVAEPSTQNIERRQASERVNNPDTQCVKGRSAERKETGRCLSAHARASMQPAKALKMDSRYTIAKVGSAHAKRKLENTAVRGLSSACDVASAVSERNQTRATKHKGEASKAVASTAKADCVATTRHLFDRGSVPEFSAGPVGPRTAVKSHVSGAKSHTEPTEISAKLSLNAVRPSQSKDMANVRENVSTSPRSTTQEVSGCQAKNTRFAVSKRVAPTSMRSEAAQFTGPSSHAHEVPQAKTSRTTPPLEALKKHHAFLPRSSPSTKLANGPLTGGSAATKKTDTDAQEHGGAVLKKPVRSGIPHICPPISRQRLTTSGNDPTEENVGGEANTSAGQRPAARTASGVTKASSVYGRAKTVKRLEKSPLELETSDEKPILPEAAKALMQPRQCRLVPLPKTQEEKAVRLQAWWRAEQVRTCLRATSCIREAKHPFFLSGRTVFPERESRGLDGGRPYPVEVSSSDAPKSFAASRLKNSPVAEAATKIHPGFSVEDDAVGKKGTSSSGRSCLLAASLKWDDDPWSACSADTEAAISSSAVVAAIFSGARRSSSTSWKSPLHSGDNTGIKRVSNAARSERDDSESTGNGEDHTKKGEPRVRGLPMSKLDKGTSGMHAVGSSVINGRENQPSSRTRKQTSSGNMDSSPESLFSRRTELPTALVEKEVLVTHALPLDPGTGLRVTENETWSAAGRWISSGHSKEDEGQVGRRLRTEVTSNKGTRQKCEAREVRPGGNNQGSNGTEHTFGFRMQRRDKRSIEDAHHREIKHWHEVGKFEGPLEMTQQRRTEHGTGTGNGVRNQNEMRGHTYNAADGELRGTEQSTLEQAVCRPTALARENTLEAPSTQCETAAKPLEETERGRREEEEEGMRREEEERRRREAEAKRREETERSRREAEEEDEGVRRQEEERRLREAEAKRREETERSRRER